MHESPRLRRLRNDFASMERLSSESSVLRFRADGRPPQRYVVEFRGRSLTRERGKVTILERHEVEIKLGAAYPRTMPEIRWLTPIYHPNISEIGMVCLGGYGTHWVPSLNLDELCGMLWDMARFHNYDIRSPYNREAALWAANQTSFLFPLDNRALRDLRVALGRVEPAPSLAVGGAPASELGGPAPERASSDSSASPTNRGSRVGKYVDFVRGLATERFSPSSNSPESTPRPESRRDGRVGAPDGMILFDVEHDPRAGTSRPRSRPDDEIVFID